jgi:putative hemolysin
MMMAGSAIAGIFLLLIISGIFTLAEDALVSSRKPRLRAKAEAPRYRRALEAAENPDALLTALRIGVILVTVFAGALGGILAGGTAARFFPGIGGFIPALVSALIFTILLVLLRSSLVRPIAQAAPENILVHTLPLIRLLKLLFTPLIFIAARSSGLTLRILKVNSPADHGMTEDELR